jgi:hypothetical protein
MLDKIGVHWNDSYGVWHGFEQWKMPVAVVLDHSVNVWRFVKTISPQTILIGRVTPDEGVDWRWAEPVIEAKRAYDRIMPMAERMWEIIDFWIQWNEPIIPNNHEGAEAMRKYMITTLELTRALAEAGVRSAVGGFSEGNPRLSFWSIYEPALRYAMQQRGIAHVHEYDWDQIGETYPWRSYRLSQVIWGNPPSVQPEPLDKYAGLPPDLFDGLTWVVSEFGLDRSEGIRKGWKTACNDNYLDYRRQIQDYNRFWMERAKPHIPGIMYPQWDKLAGVTIFCRAKNGGEWGDYNIEGECYEYLASVATPVYYDIGNTTPEPEPPDLPPDPNPPEEDGMITIKTQVRPMVGLHLRNDQKLVVPTDHSILEQAKIEAIKTMTNMLTEEIVVANIHAEETLVRIYEDGHPGSPSQFVAKHAPQLRILANEMIHKVEVLNEPNHVDGIEGWGATDEDARDFAAWFAIAAPALREEVPGIEIGFPGLAVPGFVHHDLRWLNICRPVILEHADWLGCHCYWQEGNRTSDTWGNRFKMYHDRFPHLPIHITEFGDSTPNLDPYQQASEISRYYKQISKHAYLKSAHAFIQSSPDPRWGNLPFSWTHNGEPGPVVDVVGNMDRDPLYTETPGILGGHRYIADRLMHHPTETYEERDLSDIRRLIIHHTAIPHTVGAKRIAEYHVQSKGYAGIGYHFLQPRHRPADQTQPCSLISSHCYENNSDSIGIAVRGNFQKNAPPYVQFEYLVGLCVDLIRALPQLSPEDIYGHHETPHNNSNACPGLTWERTSPHWKRQLVAEVALRLED